MGEGSPGWAGLIFVALDIWPWLLGAGLLLLVSARLAGGPLGAALALGALPLLVPVAMVGGLVAGEEWSSFQQRRHDESVTTILPAAAVVDGVALPAGARITWEDPARRRVLGVRFPAPGDPPTAPNRPSPVPVLGLPGVMSLYRQGGDRWQADLDEPATVEGWPCGRRVLLDAAGRLRGCELAKAVAWQGWTVPEGEEVALEPRGGAFLEVTAPQGAMVAPHGIGPLPGRQGFARDGALLEARYRREAPLRVPGGPALWGDVRFRHDPATQGTMPGRDRRPLAAEGGDPQDPASDGWRAGLRAVPWPPAP